MHPGKILLAAAVAASAGVLAVTASNSTTSPPATYQQAIAYTQTRPAFTPSRTVNVASGAALKAAIANLRAGDLVKASAPFTLSAGGSTDTLIVSKRLTAPAVVDLTGVKIVYTGGLNYDAVWVIHASNIRFYGGDLSTSDTGGTCLNIMGSSHILWWGFTAHDCGGTGLGMATGKPGYTSSGPVEYNDIQGETWKFGQHSAWDNHLEKCTGLHGANLADSNYFPFDNNRVALYAHDSACEGAGIEFGASQATNIPTANTIILECVNLTFVSTLQTGGNCYQTWGYGNTHTDVQYLEADNLEGHPYYAHGMYGSAGAALATDTVDYGRATNVRLNPRYAKDPNWDTKAGTVFKNVAPTP